MLELIDELDSNGGSDTIGRKHAIPGREECAGLIGDRVSVRESACQCDYFESRQATVVTMNLRKGDGIVAFVLLDQLGNASCSPAAQPFPCNGWHMIVRDDLVVGSGNKAGWGVVGGGELGKGYHATPFVFSAPARHGYAPGAVGAEWDGASELIADMSFDIRIDKILGWHIPLR